MTWKIVNGLLVALFALFAYFQLNDEDPYIWVPIYGTVALLAALALSGRLFRIPTLVLAIAGAIGVALYIPDVIDWIQAGFPSISGEMKAIHPYVEKVREGLGLLIAVVGLGLILIQTRQKS